MLADTSVFPAEVYKDTVLEPLFEGSKQHYATHLMRINRAHAVMLCECEILQENEVTRLLATLDDIEASYDPDSLTYTGEVEDFFFHVESELIKRLGVDLAGRLHTGRSRNDIDHTVFKMSLRARLDQLSLEIMQLVETLLKVAEREKATIIVAYTHGQPAQPSTYGHYLGAFIEVLLRDLDRLSQARRTVDLCSMGAAAITTSGFPIDRQRMARLLGFAAVQENAYGCIAACDYITASYSAIKLTFINIGRFVQDMAQWSAHEVGQLYVPNAYVQISSIMPQKRNPVPIEHLRHLSSLTVGRCDMVINTMHNTPFTDMNDSEGEVQESGYAAFASASRVLRLLTGLISMVQINSRRVARNMQDNCITITELADSLVRIEGLSFREAHEIAAEVAKDVLSRSGTLPLEGEPIFRKAFTKTTGRESRITSEEFKTLVSPEHFIAVRTRQGGPGESALNASLDIYRAGLLEFQELYTTRQNRQRMALTLLQEALTACRNDQLAADGFETTRFGTGA